jgi:leucyl aminopeptidase
MHRTFLRRGEVASTIPVWFVNAANWREHRDSLDAPARAFTDAAGFEPTPGRHFLIPSGQGGIARVLFAIEEVADGKKDFFRPGALADLLPAGAYRFANAPHDSRLAALAFALGYYRFTRYRKQA